MHQYPYLFVTKNTFFNPFFSLTHVLPIVTFSVLLTRIFFDRQSSVEIFSMTVSHNQQMAENPQSFRVRSLVVFSLKNYVLFLLDLFLFFGLKYKKQQNYFLLNTKYFFTMGKNRCNVVNTCPLFLYIFTISIAL